MQKSEIHIIVVEDDATFGKACREALVKHGFKSTHFLRPEEALAHCKLQPVHGAILDCMLPKMNGRDLAIALKEALGSDIPIVMMSGIFKDKNFIRDTTHATSAIKFLTKPFDTLQLGGLFDGSMKSSIDTPINPVHSLMMKHEFSPGERVRAINEVGQLHGYDLPWAMSLLMHPKISGHLNIIGENGELAGIGFSKGRIVQINRADAKSYFGVLLIEGGYISQQEMDAVLAQPANNRKVGERLIDANVLSPHAINIVLTEQQGIRLSSIINKEMFQVNFAPDEEMREDAVIENQAFSDLVDEWVRSKIPLAWMKNLYIPWDQFTVVRGPEHNQNHVLFKTETVAKVRDFANVILNSSNLGAAILKLAADHPEADVYKALHILIINRVLRFGEPTVASNFDVHRKRLTKLKADFEKQTLFERLGVTPKTREPEVKKAYYELAKVMHPDKLPANCPEDVKNLAKSTFNLVNEAYEVLSDAQAKEHYVRDMEQGQAEAVLGAEQLLDEARALLSRGDAKRGLEIIEKAIQLAPPTSETKLLHAWATVKSMGRISGTKVKELKDQLSSVPPEDRHNATYFFVKGLVLGAGGDGDGARKCHENAVAMDADFVDAKRELNIISLNAQKSKKTNDIFTGELKDLVGGLFKRR